MLAIYKREFSAKKYSPDRNRFAARKSQPVME